MQFEVNRDDFHAALSDADRGRVDAVLDLIQTRNGLKPSVGLRDM